MSQDEIDLIRPQWNEQEYHSRRWKDVTVLICQRKTRDLIQLCLGSLLSHYPDIKVLVVDGDSQDESIAWLRFMSARFPNVKIWERIGRNSHGETMHEAIMKYVTTSKVLLMDSDTLVRRHGFIEDMLLAFFQEPKLYAVGSLMLVSRSNEGCGVPKNDNDVLRYAHPSCSMYHVQTYKQLNAPFCDHGAPCVNNMIAAADAGLLVEMTDVDKYVQHLCGASWQDIPTVWDDDGDVMVRPLVTFVCTLPGHLEQLKQQTDHDFNIITNSRLMQHRISSYNKADGNNGIVNVSNHQYDVRFRANGIYVCMLNEYVTELPPDIVAQIRVEATTLGAPAEFVYGGLRIVERKRWQKLDTML